MIDVADCLFAIGACDTVVERVRSWSREQLPEDRRASRLWEEREDVYPGWQDAFLVRGVTTWEVGPTWAKHSLEVTRRSLARAVVNVAEEYPDCIDIPARSAVGISRERIRMARKLVPQLKAAGLL